MTDLADDPVAADCPLFYVKEKYRSCGSSKNSNSVGPENFSLFQANFAGLRREFFFDWSNESWCNFLFVALLKKNHKSPHSQPQFAVLCRGTMRWPINSGFLLWFFRCCEILDAPLLHPNVRDSRLRKEKIMLELLAKLAAVFLFFLLQKWRFRDILTRQQSI